jgi:hypothetical protein
MRRERGTFPERYQSNPKRTLLYQSPGCAPAFGSLREFAQGFILRIDQKPQHLARKTPCSEYRRFFSFFHAYLSG